MGGKGSIALDPLIKFGIQNVDLQAYPAPEIILH